MTPSPREPFFPPEEGQAPVPAEVTQSARPQPYTPDAPAFDRLRALARRGYVADMEVEGPGGGILLRHAGAPDIVLFPDGTVESIDRSRRKRVTSLTGDLIPAENASDERRFARFLERLPVSDGTARPPRRWRKRFVVMAMLLAVWLVSLFLTIAIVNG